MTTIPHCVRFIPFTYTEHFSSSDVKIVWCKNLLLFKLFNYSQQRYMKYHLRLVVFCKLFSSYLLSMPHGGQWLGSYFRPAIPVIGTIIWDREIRNQSMKIKIWAHLLYITHHQHIPITAWATLVYLYYRPRHYTLITGHYRMTCGLILAENVKLLSSEDQLVILGVDT